MIEMGIKERVAVSRRSVRRLANNPDVCSFTKNCFQVFVVKDFLSEYERKYLKSVIKGNLTPSGTLGEEHPTFSDFRTSSTCYLRPVDRIVAEIDRRTAELLNVDPVTGESLQGQHYTVGQTFKPHCDYFHEKQRHWKIACREGGQRVWTAMSFLDDGMEGGHTKFVNAGFDVKPQAGLLLVWNNLTDTGGCNWQTLHEGAPIISGEKTILTKWYRERNWRQNKLHAAAAGLMKSQDTGAAVAAR